MRTPAQATSLCHACPKLCRYACPVTEADQDESTTPWGKMSAMKLAEAGHLSFDEKTASLPYKCLHCRASQEACELDNPVSESLMHYRARAFRKGVAPKAIYSHHGEFQKHNNPFGKDLFRTLSLKYPEELKAPQRKIAYFPGCTEIRYFPETIGRTLKLFRGLNIELSLHCEPIPCCGYPLYAAGDMEGFRELAELHFQALRNYREVWSSDATCLYTTETLYRSLGFKSSTRFFHTAEKLAPLIEENGRKTKRKVAYHDPCTLGRFRGVYEAPREILRQVTGQAPVEFFRNREGSACCGAGGLLPVSSPETANSITRNRVDEFQRTGASTLVTSCPGCVRRFKEIHPKLNVKSLIDFVADG